MMNFLWPPLVYITALLWLYGYCSESAQSDQPDGSLGSQDSRIRSVIISFLSRLGVLGGDEPDTPQASVDIPDMRRGSDPVPTTSTPLPQPIECKKQEDIVTPKPVRTVSLTANLETTPKVCPVSDTPVPVIQHPGVSKLQKEHGILRSREKPNMSGIDKLRGSGGVGLVSGGRPGVNTTTVGGNTPRSRMMGRSYFRQKRKASFTRLGGESWSYIRWAL